MEESTGEGSLRRILAELIAGMRKCDELSSCRSIGLISGLFWGLYSVYLGSM